MNQSDTLVRTTLRIPVNCAHPGELLERLPRGFRLTPEALIMPDRTEIEFAPLPPDDQFPHIFRQSCRQPAADDELRIVDSYTANIGLIGPGGSMAAARTMLHAGAALVRAGGAGVFIDNSAISHGGRAWIELAEDGGPDALSFAFVAIIRNRQEIWTVGMHVMGLPDLAISHADAGPRPDAIIDLIRHLCAGSQPAEEGHVLVDDDGRCYRSTKTAGRLESDSPLHNPFGCLKLIGLKNIAENN